MKKKLFIILLTFTVLNCKAQMSTAGNGQIIPVETITDTFDNVIEGETEYIKDVNNIFFDYIGTWTGTINGKNYTFIINKTTIVFDEEYNTLADILVMKHLVVNANNSQIIEDTTSVSIEDSPCEGIFFVTNTGSALSYMFSYGGEQYFCGQNGNVFITLTNNNTQMYLLLYPDHEIYSECQTGLAEQILPTDKILLTKQ